MRYDRDIKVVHEILKSVDINNTLNGGRSEPQIAIRKEGESYLLTARVPGVDILDLQVEILNGKVIVHHPMLFDSDSGILTVPQVVAAFPITNGIDYENIEARKVDERLEVRLPWNDLNKGYNRHIDINF
ncbi:Hsp20/alpha crystallin family protein [Fulvivirga lutea]|uniref:Hsp20/alpha crystallin family protein n=1 Tax=Fulvivirga lutea TaxID=2810512 RepID=A0A974WFD5_9BACT|nr:Hsp20/alpha crystallin family protein [Fulvivirga lutea]QSE96473.1 Hsp20/alpha crystallin family protein [Fulvivirga lutea]